MTDDREADIDELRARIAAVRDLAENWTRIGAQESTRKGGQLILDLLDGKPLPSGAVLDVGTGPV